MGAHSAGGLLSAAVGLAPLDPTARRQLTGDPLPGNAFEWTTAGTLHPTLRRQAFPRQTDVAVSPEAMARARNMRQDRVTAREQNLVPAEIVYRREGRPHPGHQPEIMLRPGTRCFRTVRARFALDGRRRLTEWGSTQYRAREQFTAPSRYSYRFRTP